METCCESAKLCDQHREDLFAQLRGVAARRGDAWAEGLVGRVRAEIAWPDASDRMLAIARQKIGDLTSDPQLRELLANEAIKYAARSWERRRVAQTRIDRE